MRSDFRPADLGSRVAWSRHEPSPVRGEAVLEGARHDVIDALEVGIHRHMVHALLELDVTRARQILREGATSTGERLSFTAFIVASLARAIDENKRLHAYRDWRGRLVLFDEVDVVTLVESEVDAVAIPT